MHNIVAMSTIPAEDEEAEVRRKEGGGAGKKVEAVSEQNCRFSAKTASRLKVGKVGSKVGQVGSKVGQVCRAMSCAGENVYDSWGRVRLTSHW